MGATGKGIPFPDGDDAPLGPLQMAALAGWVDEYLGAHSYAEINALTGAEVWAGRRVWQTDTGAARPMQGLYLHDGVEWRKPWNLPWGEVVAPATHGLDGAGYTAYADITGLSVSFDAVTNRRYRIELDFAFSLSAAGTGAHGRLFMDAATQLQERDGAAGTGNFGSVHCAFVGTLAAGPHTIKGQCARHGGDPVTVTVVGSNPTKLSTLTVEDIGPAGAPA